jgi:hypothetical protein
MIRTILAAALAAGLLAAAACGGDDSSTTKTAASAASGNAATASGKGTTAASTGGKRDACALLTKDDAAAALGEPVNDPKDPGTGVNTGATSVSNCIASTSGTPVKSASVLLRVASAQESSTVFNGTKGGAQGAVDISGVGEKAFYNPQYGQVVILKKDAYIIVSAGRLGDRPAEPTDALKKFAKAVADRY